jgi:hypothetical protein
MPEEKQDPTLEELEGIDAITRRRLLKGAGAVAGGVGGGGVVGARGGGGGAAMTNPRRPRVEGRSGR